jgi:hypothetical protein
MARESSYFLDQVGSIDGLNLRDVDNACFRQVSFASSQAYIARQRGESKIGSNRDDDNCVQTTGVKAIVL